MRAVRVLCTNAPPPPWAQDMYLGGLHCYQLLVLTKVTVHPHLQGDDMGGEMIKAGKGGGGQRAHVCPASNCFLLLAIDIRGSELLSCNPLFPSDAMSQRARWPKGNLYDNRNFAFSTTVQKRWSPAERCR